MPDKVVHCLLKPTSGNANLHGQHCIATQSRYMITSRDPPQSRPNKCFAKTRKAFLCKSCKRKENLTSNRSFLRAARSLWREDSASQLPHGYSLTGQNLKPQTTQFLPPLDAQTLYRHAWPCMSLHAMRHRQRKHWHCHVFHNVATGGQSGKMQAKCPKHHHNTVNMFNNQCVPNIQQRTE